MIINQKIRLKFIDEESKNSIDRCSSLCNKMYNMLLEECKNDYENNNDSKNLLHGRSLRNYIVSIKKEHPYFYFVHSSPLKNVAFRLKEAYLHFFAGSGYPKFRSNRIKWFSLLYDEPNKGIKIENKNLRISLGYELKDGIKVRKYAYAHLYEKVRKGVIRNFRITKEKDEYYIVVCLEKEDKEVVKGDRVISLDLNHKNFFVGIDNKGKSVEFENLFQIKYFDEEIDKVKAKRDKCLRKSIKCINEYGNVYHKPSRRYSRLNKALEKLYYRRRAQIKDGLYLIAHRLCDNYDVIAIGDYSPSISNSSQKNMHRKMLNQSVIAMFRKIISNVCNKRRKQLIIVDEMDTTKECFCCGDKKHKDPSIREYTCPKCGKTYNRDINSAINIGKKAKVLSSSDYVSLDLTKPTYIARYNLFKQSISTIIK